MVPIEMSTTKHFQVMKLAVAPVGLTLFAADWKEPMIGSRMVVPEMWTFWDNNAANLSC